MHEVEVGLLQVRDRVSLSISDCVISTVRSLELHLVLLQEMAFVLVDPSFIASVQAVKRTFLVLHVSHRSLLERFRWRDSWLTEVSKSRVIVVRDQQSMSELAFILYCIVVLQTLECIERLVEKAGTDAIGSHMFLLLFDGSSSMGYFLRTTTALLLWCLFWKTALWCFCRFFITLNTSTAMIVTLSYS